MTVAACGKIWQSAESGGVPKWVAAVSTVAAVAVFVVAEKLKDAFYLRGLINRGAEAASFLASPAAQGYIGPRVAGLRGAITPEGVAEAQVGHRGAIERAPGTNIP